MSCKIIQSKVILTISFHFSMSQMHAEKVLLTIFMFISFLHLEKELHFGICLLKIIKKM